MILGYRQTAAGGALRERFFLGQRMLPLTIQR